MTEVEVNYNSKCPSTLNYSGHSWEKVDVVADHLDSCCIMFECGMCRAVCYEWRPISDLDDPDRQYDDEKAREAEENV